MDCPECNNYITGEECRNCLFNIHEIEVNNIFNIYVLKCEDKSSGYKYYVGKTNNEVSIRFNQHKNNNNNCAWTNKYPPIELIETIQSKDPLDEDKITKKYMMKYGIENVRGGSYTKLVLEEWMIKCLEHEFTSAKDICYNCNEKGHFIRECPLNNKFNIQKYLEEFKEFYMIDEEINKLEKVYEEIIILNHQINITNQFDINKYNKLITDIKELDIIILSLQKKLEEIETSPDNDPKYRYNKYSQQRKDLLQEKRNEIFELQKEKSVLQSQLNSISIIPFYEKLFVNDKIYIHNKDNDVIKLCKLQVFNLEKKKELKGLLSVHTSEDLIKMKLSGLYEKKIKMLKD